MAGRATITTVTPAESYDLTTLVNVKDELGITDTSKDARLGRFITSASAAIAQFCNRQFVAEAIVEQIWPQRDFYPEEFVGGVQPLQLTRWPIVTLDSVVENGVTLTSETDFSADPEKGQLVRLDSVLYPTNWPSLPIVVSYTAGFATVPADVEDAAIRLVKARYLATGRDPFLRQEMIPGVREAQYWVPTGNDAGNMPPDVEDILTNYRVPVLG